MMFTDLYDLLGVQPNATDDQIKAAYRDKAKASHPDVVPVDQRAQAEDTMARLNHAYGTLLNPDKRRAYDERGIGTFPGGGEENQREALEAMGQAFDAFLEMTAYIGNPIEGAKNILLEGAVKASTAASQARRDLNSMERTRDRLKLKNQKADIKTSLLYRALSKKIDACQAVAAKHDHNSTVLGLAATLIDSYAFEVEPVQTNPIRIISAFELFGSREGRHTWGT